MARLETTGAALIGSVIGGCQVGQFVLIECPSCPNSCVLVTLIVVCPSCLNSCVTFECRLNSLNVGHLNMKSYGHI